MAAPLDVWLKAGAGLSLVLLAGSLAMGSRRPPARWLSAFLLLVAANQGFEAVRSAGTAHDVLLHRLATVVAALDPFVLYWASVKLLPSERAERPWALAAAFVPGAILALTSPLAQPGPAMTLAGDLHRAALTAFTAVVYLLVLIRFLRAQTSAALRPLLVALALAAVPLLPRLSQTIHMALGNLIGFGYSQDPPWAWAGAIVLGLAVILGAAGPARRDRALHGSLVGGVLLAAVIDSLPFYAWFVLQGRSAEPDATLRALGAGGAAIRWLVFGIIASVALVRHDALGMSVTARRRAARVLVGSGVGAAATLLVVLLRAATNDALLLSPTEWMLIGFVLVTSQAARSLIDVVARHVYAVPATGDTAGAMETYRRALDQADSDAHIGTREADLARLRQELGLSEEIARVIERSARSHADWLEPGMTVAARYRLLRSLPRGATGRILVARDELLARDVVLKEVPHIGADPAIAVREARLAGGINHPNVVRVHDAIVERGRSLLVMEYVPGGSLQERLDRGDPLAAAQSRRILADVLAGLAAVHARGIVHRDVKPANVLLSPDGTAKLTDFGLARIALAATNTLGSSDAFAGTPEYMAPEQRRGEPASLASDLYAVGILARRLGGGGALAAVIERALQEDPARRWESAQQMRDALGATPPSPT